MDNEDPGKRCYVVTDDYAKTHYIVMVDCDSNLQGLHLARYRVSMKTGLPESRLSAGHYCVTDDNVVALAPGFDSPREVPSLPANATDADMTERFLTSVRWFGLETKNATLVIEAHNAMGRFDDYEGYGCGGFPADSQDEWRQYGRNVIRGIMSRKWPDTPVKPARKPPKSNPVTATSITDKQLHILSELRPDIAYTINIARGINVMLMDKVDDLEKLRDEMLEARRVCAVHWNDHHKCM